MKKKIIISIFVTLFLVVGGVFYWWQDQAEVRELNKNLPEGIRVTKSLIGNEYRVINKIDGYEFKVPEEWGGLLKIEYMPEREVNGMRNTGFILTSPVGEIVGMDQYKTDNPTIELEKLVKEFFEPGATLEKQQIGNYKTIRTKLERLAGMYIYFLKNDLRIYAIAGFSDENIREIILNGKW